MDIEELGKKIDEYQIENKKLYEQIINIAKKDNTQNLGLISAGFALTIIGFIVTKLDIVATVVFSLAAIFFAITAVRLIGQSYKIKTK